VKVLTVIFQITFLMSLAMSTNLDSRINIQRSTAVAVGEVAPDFTLEDQNGQKVVLSDARGKSPVVLVFYRGYW
jgi:cytochrome oxidase Cu insertion factor (SCO1/SenC/PrrC family)